MKKYKGFFQYLYPVSAVLVLVAGIVVLANHAAITAGVPLWIGLLLMAAGVCEGVAGRLWHKTNYADKGFSSRAVLKVVVGLMILCQGIFVGAVMWVLMSMMLVMGGLHIFQSGWKVRKAGMKRWLVIGPVSALEALLGLLCFLDPAMLGTSTGVALGIGLICAACVDGCVWYLGRLLKVYS